MTTAEIDQLLYRPIKPGTEYNQYFDSSNCKSTKLGKGNTALAIKNMAKWSKKYAYQSQKIAEVLKGQSLIDTCKNIQDFLYWHFRYKIDGQSQYLKAPACAWATRYEGQDCKTYSILASTILLNLGIKHYLRRISQSMYPNAFTHVYVVIPHNQSTGKLNQGYAVIDGTIEKNSELPFIKKDDVYMEPKLPIYGLASPQMQSGCGCGCNGHTSTYSSNPPGLGINFSDLDNLFGGSWAPSCIGGTYDGKDLKKTVQLVTHAFNELYASINVAISSQDMLQIETIANTIIMSSQQFRNQAMRTKSHNWSSKCSKNTTKGFYQLGAYYFDVYMKAFLPYLRKSYTVNLVQVMVPNNDYPFPTRSGSDGLKKNEFVKDITVQAIESMALKSNVTSIPKFELTPYLVEQVDGTGFNFNSFLETLTNTALTITGLDNNNGSNNGNNNGSNNGNNSNQGDPNSGNTPPPDKPGIGASTVIGAAALIAGGIYASKKLL